MKKNLLLFSLVILTLITTQMSYSQTTNNTNNQALQQQSNETLIYSDRGSNNSGWFGSLNLISSWPVVFGGAENYDYGYNLLATVDIGYLFDFGNNLGFSILGEIGYNFSSYGNSRFVLFDGERSTTISAQSILVGIMPKFNFYQFSLGVGAGVKIPFWGITYTGGSNFGIFSFMGKYLDNIDPTPYIKVLLEYNLIASDLVAVVFGINTGYDFSVSDNLYKASVESYFIGIQIGIKFGSTI